MGVDILYYDLTLNHRALCELRRGLHQTVGLLSCGTLRRASPKPEAVARDVQERVCNLQEFHIQSLVGMARHHKIRNNEGIFRPTAFVLGASTEQTFETNIQSRIRLQCVQAAPDSFEASVAFEEMAKWDGGKRFTGREDCAISANAKQFVGQMHRMWKKEGKRSYK
ncbi:hypothetical protein EYF80_041633 [Liparis tanakae]|uniref:Uncharacterized protein n=1 Tax=Liparis tanakae TaxID=230148 RepID=A0A4Z2G5L6_9TELE|nr:hypothetical protein EYF80_041633 [Liparis tanakae]